jgi:protein-disulfide isomerase
MSLKNIILLAFGLVLAIGLSGLLLWQFTGSVDKPVADISGDRRNVLGSGEVEIVEFSDLECPACASVQTPLKELLTKYEGKVSLVYRHFPLSSIHPQANLAARLTEAAALQGKFWEMHDLLFERQREWASSDLGELIPKYAEELELDLEKLLSELESSEVKAKVNNDLLAATRNRLTGTPSFYVNGVATPFELLESAIEVLVK